MNTCETFAALLDPYIDGELTAEEAGRVREHLETCAACRSYVDDAFAIRAAFPDAEDAEVPEGFADAVLESIRAVEARKSFQKRNTPGKREQPHRKLPWARTVLPLAACCALVILLAQGPLSPAKQAGALKAVDTAAPTAMEDSAPESAEEGGEADYDLSSGYEESCVTAQAALPEPEAAAAPQAPAADSVFSPEDGGMAQSDLDRAAGAPIQPRTVGGMGDDSLESSPEPKLSQSFSSVPSGGSDRETQKGEEVPAPAMLTDAPNPEEAPEDLDGGEEAWVQYGNVVFACVVYLEKADVGDALDGFEGRPYSNANFPEEGVIGSGYALEQADFERILDELNYPVGPALNQDRTTELNCIVVTE